MKQRDQLVRHLTVTQLEHEHAQAPNEPVPSPRSHHLLG